MPSKLLRNRPRPRSSRQIDLVFPPGLMISLPSGVAIAVWRCKLIVVIVGTMLTREAFAPSIWGKEAGERGAIPWGAFAGLDLVEKRGELGSIPDKAFEASVGRRSGRARLDPSGCVCRPRFG